MGSDAFETLFSISAFRSFVFCFIYYKTIKLIWYKTSHLKHQSLKHCRPRVVHCNRRSRGKYQLTGRRRFNARRVIGGGGAVGRVGVLVVQAAGRSASLQVLAGGAEDTQWVSSVQRARSGERRAATLVRTTVEDLVVWIAWKEIRIL